MAISYVGGSTGSDTAVAPAHIAGDIICVFAYNETNSIIPGKPAQYTEVDSALGGNNGFITGYLVATSDSETVGTWANAESVLVQVYRGSAGSLSVGSSPSRASGFGTDIDFPALVLDDSSGNSWVAGFAGHRSNNVNLSIPPTGMVNRTYDTPSISRAGGNDTNGGVSSWSLQTVAAGGSSSTWHSSAIEIVEASASGITLTVDSGSYNLTGTSTSLKTAFKSAIDSGVYSLSGTATNLIVDSKVIAESGSYTIAGSSADLVAARKSIIESGSYNLTGSSVDLIYTPASGGEVLVVDSGSFSLTGADVGLIINGRTAIESGNYNLTGQSIQLTYNSNIVASSGTYAITGQDISLFASYVTMVASGSYNLTGYPVTLRYSGDTSQAIGTVTTSFADDKFTASYKPNSITVTFKA